MKAIILAAVVAVSGSLIARCDDAVVPRAPIPAPNDAASYRPIPQPKPLPPEATGEYPGGPNGPPVAITHQALPEEENFVKAYEAARSPRIMVFVNRTIQGDILPKDNLEELIKVEDTQSSTGAVKVNSQNGTNDNSTSNSAVGGYDPSASNTVTNSNTSRSNSFETGNANGAVYQHTTTIKTDAPPPSKYDSIGASRTDYEAIELSLMNYMTGPGVDIRDSDILRSKLDREQELRLENNDRGVLPLLKQEFQTDVLIQVAATPTSHASVGQAVRMLAKAIRTTDGRVLASDYQDLPLPLTKTVINVFTRRIAQNLMVGMANVWGNGAQPVFDPIEVRIYKVASVDDALTLRSWINKVRGVRGVTTRGATGGSNTAYAVLAVEYDGPPEDLYADLKENAGTSTGLKATDLQGNTIDLEVTGPMDLHTVTTTTKTEVKTETHTETRTDVVQPVNPAAPPATNQ
jgi:hypothetical protein